MAPQTNRTRAGLGHYFDNIKKTFARKWRTESTFHSFDCDTYTKRDAYESYYHPRFGIHCLIVCHR